MSYCARCGGVFSKAMFTEIVDGKEYHLYCAGKQKESKNGNPPHDVRSNNPRVPAK